MFEYLFIFTSSDYDQCISCEW